MIAHMAMFIALEVVMSRVLGITTPITRISFGFIPFALCASMYGVVPAAIVGVSADLIGANLFPMGPYFPPLAITIVLNAINYGLLLNYKSNPGFVRTTLAAALSNFVMSLCVQTLWLTMLYGNRTYTSVLIARIPQSLVIFGVQVLVFPIIVKLAERLSRIGAVNAA